MSELTRRYNKNLLAKEAIQKVGDFRYPPRPQVVAQLKVLCDMVVKGLQMDEFPDANANISTIGNWERKQHEKIKKMMADEKIDDHKLEDIITPIEPQTPAELANFVGADARIAEILASAIRKWLEDAGAFEENRRRSARLQLENCNCPPDQIEALLANPVELRRFIQEQRRELVDQLKAIKLRATANNPLDLLLPKEIELYNKHKAWFESGDEGADNPYPNDNVVPYAFLIVEILNVVVKHASGVPGNLWKAYESFCSIFASAASKDSNNKAWLALAQCPNFPVEGYDVGSAMREYVTDARRCAKSTKSTGSAKLQSGLQRGPRRLHRIVSISIVCRSQFTILNLDAKDFARQLAVLYGREEQSRVAINSATNIGRGAVGLSDAESMAWLSCLGRSYILPPAWGRNDCSLPKLVGGLVGIDVSMFANLGPRPYAVTRINP